jgi:hypothetical protein
MSMEIETRLSDQLARYLDLAASQAKLTAANMANIDTPGYRAVGMDFEAEMREAMDGVDQGRQSRHGSRNGGFAFIASRRSRCGCRKDERSRESDRGHSSRNGGVAFIASRRPRCGCRKDERSRESGRGHSSRNGGVAFIASRRSRCGCRKDERSWESGLKHGWNGAAARVGLSYSSAGCRA